MLLFATAVGVVLIVSFMCSIFESVLLSLSRPQIEVMRRRGLRAGQLLMRFRENMDVPIAAILIVNTAAHTIGAAVAGASYSSVFAPDTLWIFSLVFTLAVLLFTEIIPKTLGIGYARQLATPVAYGIQWLTVALKPLVALSGAISRSLRRDSDAPVTSIEEIRSLAALGRREGIVGDKTAGMIVGATHLRHLSAGDVALPRESVRFLSGGMSRQEVSDYIQRTKHSRFPFTPSKELDDVTGVVLTKEVLHWLLNNDDEEVDWASLQNEPLIVPSSVPLNRLLVKFQETRRHLAIIVDEYGTVEGIATLEDVLEEIVGEILDESDAPLEDFDIREDGALIVDARVDLRKLCAKLEMRWDASADATSIGGLVTERLERIPRVGDSLEWRGHKIEVVGADRRRVKRLAIQKPASKS